MANLKEQTVQVSVSSVNAKLKERSILPTMYVLSCSMFYCEDQLPDIRALLLTSNKLEWSNGPSMHPLEQIPLVSYVTLEEVRRVTPPICKLGVTYLSGSMWKLETAQWLSQDQAYSTDSKVNCIGCYRILNGYTHVTESLKLRFKNS